MRCWWVYWRRTRTSLITSWGEKHHSKSLKKECRWSCGLHNSTSSSSLAPPPPHSAGVRSCRKLRSPTALASVAPPATPTRRPAVRCRLTTTTRQCWVSGGRSRGAPAMAEAVQGGSSVPRGRFLEAMHGEPKVSRGTTWMFATRQNDVRRTSAMGLKVNITYPIRRRLWGARQHLGDLACHPEANSEGPAALLR